MNGNLFKILLNIINIKVLSGTPLLHWRLQAFHWKPHIFMGDPKLFNGDPIYSLETPKIFIGDPIFSLETPRFYRRPPNFYYRPQTFHRRSPDKHWRMEVTHTLNYNHNYFIKRFRFCIMLNFLILEIGKISLKLLI